MTPREFLQANIDVIDPTLIKQAGKDLNELSTDAWYNKYKDQFINNKDTAIDFLKINKGTTLPERLRKAFGDYGFNPKDIHKQAIYQTQFKDVPREEFERVLNNMKKYYDYEQNLKEEKRLRNERIQEVKEPDWKRALFASEYENQRYIDDPKSAIFGKQAPGFINSSTGAKADLISGMAAGAADVGTAFIPVPGVNILANSVAGPAIRAGRDVAHKVSDSPYQKDWIEIGTNFGSDAGLNLGIGGLANARRYAGIAKNYVSPNVAKTINLIDEGKEIRKGLRSLPKVENTNEFVEAVSNLPNSQLKTALESTIDYANKGVDLEKARDIVKGYARDTDPVMIGSYKRVGPGGVNNLEPVNTDGKLYKAILQEPPTTNYLNEVLRTPRLKSPGDISQYYLLRLINGINVGKPGTIGLETIATAKGRGSRPEIVSTEESNAKFIDDKNKLKAQFGDLWIKYGDVFKPEEIEGDPAWEAYKEVRGIKK